MRVSDALCIALALPACGGQLDTLPPRGQILLYIDTDAPLPPAPGALEQPGSAPWLFDRLRIEVRRGGELVPQAADDFPIDSGKFLDGPVSLGIAPEPGDETLTARVQLFRGDRTREGEPLPSAVIESHVRLPAVAAEGIESVFVSLHVDDTGVPLGLDEPLAPEIGEPPAGSLVNSWPGAAIVPCSGEAVAGEACIPGGAFWMGDADLRGSPEIVDADRERLVVLSPFYLDLTEVTVADFRELASDLEQQGEILPPEWSGGSSAADRDDYATFTSAAHPADPEDLHAALPVSAIVWSTARAYCRLRGKDLPSEVMLEFVASGRGRENAYVWGNDDPTCQSAVVGRAGVGVYASFEGACRSPTSIGGVAPPGSIERDRLAGEDGQVVVDLAGNLSEWTRDWLLEQDELPWSEPGVLWDPEATEPGRQGELRTVRGSSWRSGFVALRAGARSGRDPAADNRSLGFRCARADR